MGFSYQGSQNARFGIVAGKEREEEYQPSDDDDQTFTKKTKKGGNGPKMRHLLQKCA